MGLLNKKQATTITGGSLTPKPEPTIEPTRKCQNPACATFRPSSDMINFIMVIGSPGHKDLVPFQCLETEHWACSVDCWRTVAHACIEEHMHEYLLDLHSVTPESVHHVGAISKRSQ